MAYKAEDRYGDRSVLGFEVRSYRDAGPDNFNLGVTLFFRSAIPWGSCNREVTLHRDEGNIDPEICFDGVNVLRTLADDLSSLAKELRQWESKSK